jgi:hypothetical protein
MPALVKYTIQSLAAPRIGVKGLITRYSNTLYDALDEQEAELMTTLDLWLASESSVSQAFVRVAQKS